MKHAKKLASLLLALVMVFAMSVTAFATGTDTPTGSITVDNPVTGETYTAYKIFDMVYNEGQSAYSYTISNTNEWFSTVQAYANTTDSGLTLTASASDSTVYVVETDSTKFSAPNFAETLQTKLKEGSFTPSGTKLEVDTTTGKPTAIGLDLGYYFVTSSTGALCNLTTTNPSVTIHDKNDIPFEKVDDQQSVDVGQTVNYTITGKVPDTTGFTTYTYKVTDKMTKGLTPTLTVDNDGKISSGVTITVGGEDKTSDWTIAPVYGLYDATGAPKTTDSNGDTVTKDTAGAVVVGFTATIDLAPGGTAKYTVGQAITVTYSAVVNENAVEKIEKNHAVLTYSNDPTSSDIKDSKPEEETVYSAKIVIDKYEKETSGTDTNTKLPNAEFVLYKEVTTGEGGAAVTTKQYYKWNETDKKVEWVTLTEGQTVAQAITAKTITAKTTNDQGSASFDGLADGTYYLLETKAPAGYNLLKDPVTVTVNGASATAADLGALTATAQVANETGSLLPSTGGMGTTLFYILGGVLVIGAAVLLVVRRRMRTKK